MPPWHEPIAIDGGHRRVGMHFGGELGAVLPIFEDCLAEKLDDGFAAGGKRLHGHWILALHDAPDGRAEEIKDVGAERG